MDLAALQHLLGEVPGKRVACVGDLMVDRFIYGAVNRVSPEAPIPVLVRTHELKMLGAAGNVARNIAALGGSVALVGLIGGDAEGHEALRLVGEDARYVDRPGRTSPPYPGHGMVAGQSLREDWFPYLL